MKGKENQIVEVEEVEDEIGQRKTTKREGEKESSKDEQAYHVDTAKEPQTFEEAADRPDTDLWQGAMLEELKVFEKIGLYEEVEQLTQLFN